ncbi:MAG TPA: 16S rRNA (uracil(1498)-N(3))-methyltransferase [Pseudolabrys sp.]|nr:16S rRNA (uracil(1498)-N(3))-methyltransferase [Pseudolabrys sp.]
MARYDFQSPRLFTDLPLSAGADVPLDPAQSNYLGNVLRLKQGDTVLLFNGRDGEWNGNLAGSGKRAGLKVGTQARPQPAASDLHFLFAPLKHARLDYMVQKAVEMGASRLQPVITQHTQVARVNLARMRANAIEAAQQCGVLALPEIAEPIDFAKMLLARPPERLLVFCDEDADIADPVTALEQARLETGRVRSPLAVLTGPEGGFAEQERALLLKQPGVVRLSLGPRILRADTAAVAALALVQAVLGDWTADRE